MHAFCGTAIGNITQINSERLAEEPPGLFGLQRGAGACTHHFGKTRLVGDMRKVVVQRALDQVLIDRITEPLDHAVQNVGREQMQQHQPVGLLGQLIAIRGVAALFEHPV